MRAALNWVSSCSARAMVAGSSVASSRAHCWRSAIVAELGGRHAFWRKHRTRRTCVVSWHSGRAFVDRRSSTMIRQNALICNTPASSMTIQSTVRVRWRRTRGLEDDLADIQTEGNQFHRHHLSRHDVLVQSDVTGLIGSHLPKPVWGVFCRRHFYGMTTTCFCASFLDSRQLSVLLNSICSMNTSEAALQVSLDKNTLVCYKGHETDICRGHRRMPVLGPAVPALLRWGRGSASSTEKPHIDESMAAVQLLLNVPTSQLFKNSQLCICPVRETRSAQTVGNQLRMCITPSAQSLSRMSRGRYAVKVAPPCVLVAAKTESVVAFNRAERIGSRRHLRRRAVAR